MIELVLTVCALANPTECHERSIGGFEAQHSFQCMMQAPPAVAAWSEEHPKLKVLTWKCRVAGQEANI